MKELLKKLFVVEYTKYHPFGVDEFKLATRVLFLGKWEIALYIFDYKNGEFIKL